MERLIIVVLFLNFISCTKPNKTIEPLEIANVKQIFVTDSEIYLSRLQGLKQHSTIARLIDSNKVENLGHFPNNFRHSFLYTKTDNTFKIMFDKEGENVDTTRYEILDLGFKNHLVKMKTNVGWIDFDQYEIKKGCLWLYNKGELLECVNVNNVTYKTTNDSNLISIFIKKEGYVEVYDYKFTSENINKIKEDILQSIL